MARDRKATVFQCRRSWNPTPSTSLRAGSVAKTALGWGTLIRIVPRIQNSISRPILDPDWGAYEAESFANLIFQKALIGEMELHLAVGEENECRR